MGAREALKNYHATMVRMYGENYTDHWTEDDKTTFEILARRARKVVGNMLIRLNDNTPFLIRRFSK